MRLLGKLPAMSENGKGRQAMSYNSRDSRETIQARIGTKGYETRETARHKAINLIKLRETTTPRKCRETTIKLPENSTLCKADTLCKVLDTKLVSRESRPVPRIAVKLP